MTRDGHCEVEMISGAMKAAYLEQLTVFDLPRKNSLPTFMYFVIDLIKLINIM
jgi:hypothetical protein